MIRLFASLCLLFSIISLKSQGIGTSVGVSPVNSYVGLNQFERAILDRNGDVYVLVTPSNPNQPRDVEIGRAHV